MQSFTVKYRDPRTGRLAQDVVEANSRSELFDQLRRRGISPVSVALGGLKPQDARRPEGTKIGAKELVIGAVCLLGVVAILLFSLSGDEGRRKPSSATEKAKPVQSPEKEKKSAPPAAKTPTPPKESAGTNGTADKVAVDVPSVEEARQPVATNVPAAAKAPVKRTFNTGTEQVMGWIFTTRLGDNPPPLPRLSANELKNIDAILSMPNDPEEGDGDDVRDQKETVALVKKMLKDYMSKGGSAEEFLSYYRQELVSANKLYKDAQRSVMMAAQTEDKEVVREMILATNKEFKERGIKPLMVPQHLADQLGIEANMPKRKVKKENMK